MTEHAREHLPPLEEMPAAHLAGLELPNGWVVRDIVLRGPAATGGFHSIPYTVVNGSGEEAFLKALNFHEALRRPGPLVNHIKEATDAFVFERDLLEGCRNDRLSRIIRLLDHGEIEVPGGGALARVPYLILELADGDIRKFQAALRQFDIAWVLRTLKHVTLGIEQLHSRHTTHQDLKPSNILTQQSGREMKLGDLGRAERRGVSGPFSSLPIPGALAYAPPEQLYGAFDHSWEMRRASDIYHLGSLAVQLFTGHCLRI